MPGTVIHRKFDILPQPSEKTKKRNNEVMLPCGSDQFSRCSGRGWEGRSVWAG